MRFERAGNFNGNLQKSWDAGPFVTGFDLTSLSVATCAFHPSSTFNISLSTHRRRHHSKSHAI